MRGGKREGAGRPAPDGARVTIAARVTSETRERLTTEAEQRHMSLGHLLDELAKDLQR